VILPSSLFALFTEQAGIIFAPEPRLNCYLNAGWTICQGKIQVGGENRAIVALKWVF